MTKFLTLGIFFSTAVRAVVVAMLVTLDVGPLTSFILALKEALVAKLVISGTLFSIFLISALYTSFLMTSFFTTSLSLLKSKGRCTNLLISNLFALYFKLAKSNILGNFDVWTPDSFFSSD